MFQNFQIKINNIAYSSGIMEISEPVIISWSYDKNRIVVVDQESFDNIYEIDQDSFLIKIADNSTNLGQTSFIGNIIDSTQISTVSKYIIPNNTLRTGNTYYGQINVKNKNEVWSGWQIFKIKYNEIPTVVSLNITPSSPSINDNLSLDYTLSSSSSASKIIIKWYKNDEYMFQFDQYTSIANEYLNYGDTWKATISVTDGHSYSRVFYASSVTVDSQLSSASGFKILPIYPNENDILKASYEYNDNTSERQDIIKWYINGILQQTNYNTLYARLNLSVGDSVYYTVTAFDGVNEGTTQVSETKTIEISPLRFISLSLDGQRLLSDFEGLVEQPLYIIDNSSPFISWIIGSSSNNIAQKLKIQIGSGPYQEDTYSEELDISNDVGSLSIPPSILDIGDDYYLSFSLYSSYQKKYTSKVCYQFRVKGSYWENNVNNSVGWAIEIKLKYPYPNTSSPAYNDLNFHAFRISDGTKYAELRIYNTKIGIYSDELYLSEEFLSSDVSQDFDTIIVSGKDDDMFVYFNGEKIIDGTDKLTQETSDTKILLSVSKKESDDFGVAYKSVSYTVQDAYSPSMDPYDYNYYYKDVFEIRDEEIIGISKIKQIQTVNDQDTVVNRVFMATRPFDTRLSSSIFELKSGSVYSHGATPLAHSVINDISLSQNGKNTAFAYSGGFALMQSYPIVEWDYENIFSDSFDWIDDFKFELVSNTQYTSAYYDNGLIILTTHANSKLY